MPATDLRFFKRLPVTTALRFNEVPPPSVDIYNTATMDATRAVGATAAISTYLGYLAGMDAAIGVSAVANLTAYYDNSVNRAPHLNAASVWEVADPAPASIAAPHRVSAKAEANPTPAIADGLRVEQTPAIAWRDTDHSQRPALSLPWGEALRRAASVAESWRDLFRGQRPAVVASFTEANSNPVWLTDAWQDRHRRPRPALVVPWGEGKRLARSLTASFGAGSPRLVYVRVPWQEARRPPPGTSLHGSTEPPVHVPCYVPNTLLRFWDLASTVSLDLRFRCPNVNPGPGTGETIVIPIRRVYMQINTQSLVLASTGQQIMASGLSLSIDVDSWVWGWSASVPGAYLPLLQDAGGGRVELIATLNGTAFRLAVESVARNRRFGSSTLKISGRGRAAWLAAPYADIVTRSNAEAMTAQQLLADALTVNGVSIGWTIDWQITDWLVPAGAWSHTGTAIEAALAIAEAGGAYIQAHRNSQILSVLPRYPLPPWQWNTLTPDFQLPEDVCVTEGIEWVEKPAYNTVFVSGQSGGLVGHVTVQGSAGDKAAPMVTDPLTTHADAARQRGIAVLSDTGVQRNVMLSLPVLPETGIIPPGKLVSYIEGGRTHLGLTRSVQVAANFPKLRQTIGVECHGL